MNWDQVQQMSIHREPPLGFWRAVKQAEKARHFTSGDIRQQFGAVIRQYTHLRSDQHLSGHYFLFPRKGGSSVPIDNPAEAEAYAIEHAWLSGSFEESAVTHTTVYANPRNIVSLMHDPKRQEVDIHYADKADTSRLKNVSYDDLVKALENAGLHCEEETLQLDDFCSTHTMEGTMTYFRVNPFASLGR